jgi:hypothetical protein
LPHLLKSGNILKTKIAFTCAFTFCFYVGFSQASIADQETDSISEKKSVIFQRRSSHYLGVQANQLIRQLLNFSGTNAVIDNPYLIAYSVNSKTTGLGFSSGLGFSINEISDGDQTNRRTTKINNVSLRLGFEKKSNLGKKWFVSWGFDVTRDDFKNETSNTQSQDLTNPNVKFVSTTTNKTSSWGFGPRFTLNFRVTDRIVLGTEANYYYKSGSNSTKAASSNTFFEFDQFGNKTLVTRSTDTPESSSDFTKFQFVIPAVLYLIVKF